MKAQYQSLKGVKTRLRNSGIKQKWVAEKIGMAESQLSEILSGKRKPKNIPHIIKKIQELSTREF